MEHIEHDNHRVHYISLRIFLVVNMFILSLSVQSQILRSRATMLLVQPTKDSIADFKKSAPINVLIIYDDINKKLKLIDQDSSRNKIFDLVKYIERKEVKGKEFEFASTELLLGQNGEKVVGSIISDTTGIKGLILTYDDCKYLYMGAPIGSKSLNEFFTSGNSKELTGNFHGAISDYSKAIDVYPDFTEAYNLRGSAKFRLKNYEGAVVDFSKSIELNPKEAKYYLNRGMAQNELKDYEGALSDYNKSIEINSSLERSYYSRGLLKFNLDDFRGAIADYNKAIEINPKFGEAFGARANAKFALHNLKDAISDFTIAISINPKDASAYHDRGLAKWAMNQKEEGCLDLSKAGELGLMRAYETIKKYCNK